MNFFTKDPNLKKNFFGGWGGWGGGVGASVTEFF